MSRLASLTANITVPRKPLLWVINSVHRLKKEETFRTSYERITRILKLHLSTVNRITYSRIEAKRKINQCKVLQSEPQLVPQSPFTIEK